MVSQLPFQVGWSALLPAIALIPGSNSHGQVNRVVGNGITNKGPNQYYPPDPKNKKTAVRVMYQAGSPFYILPSGFSDNSKMSCEGSSKSGAPLTLSVKAGSTLSIFWEGASDELRYKPGTGGLTVYNPWVHAMGQVQDYMTSCGPSGCSTFDTTNAGWTKIAAMGIDLGKSISPELRDTMAGKPEAYHPTGAGLWGMAVLVQQGSRWDITIPKTLASGEYIVRNELAAVHSPKKSGDANSGPQIYIACVQVKVTDGGITRLPAGVQANKLYDSNDAFANFDVYQKNASSTFVLPGPAVWDNVSTRLGEQAAEDVAQKLQTRANTPLGHSSRNQKSIESHRRRSIPRDKHF